MELLLEFQDVFSSLPNDLGRTSVTKYMIDTGDARPIHQTPCRLPLAKQENTQVETMLKQGVIEALQGLHPLSWLRRRTALCVFVLTIAC